MAMVATALVALVAIEHLYFMILEMFLWRTEKGMKTFGTCAVLLLLAGCSSAPQAKLPGAVLTSTPIPKPTTYYGETATAIASQVKGCADVKA